MSDKRIFLLLFTLFIPSIASANLGLVDRWRITVVSLWATCCTVYTVQFLLSITAILLLIWKKDNPFLEFFRKGASMLSRNEYMKLFSSWFLAAFVLTPYLALPCYLLFFLAGVFFLMIVLLSVLFVLSPALLKWISGEKTLSVMLHLSFSAFVGYIVYYLIWDTPLIQTRFSQEDNSYPIDGPYWKPDQFTGLDFLFDYGLDLLAITLMPYLVKGAVMFIRDMKQRKLGAQTDTVNE